MKVNSPEDFSKSPFLAAPGSLPLAVPSLVLHLTVIVPVGGVRATLSVTLPSDSSSAYFVLILPLASLKKARGPCFLPPLIFACAEHHDWPQTRQRNHPRHREMDTTHLNDVKAPLRDGTPRSCRLASWNATMSTASIVSRGFMINSEIP